MSDKVEGLSCWRCGADLPPLLLPLPRHEACDACGADLHVCRMCRHYDISVAKDCREPVADEVNDKERANFCDYIELRGGGYDAQAREEAEKARARLESLFGLAEPPKPAKRPVKKRAVKKKQAEQPVADDPAEAARRELERLFGKEGG